MSTQRALVIFHSDLVEAIRQWRQESEKHPNQFLISEHYRQISCEVYAEQVASYLIEKIDAINEVMLKRFSECEGVA